MYARMAAAARHRAVSEFDVHVTEKLLHERVWARLGQRPALARVGEVNVHGV